MPILRACTRCAAPFVPRHDRHRHCPLHEPTFDDRSPTTRNRPTSSTQREAIRQDVLARDPDCQIRYDGCTGTSTVVDHIVAAADGGSYTTSNLRGACDHCNSVRGGRRQTSALEHGPDDRDRGPAERRGQPVRPVFGPTTLA